MLDNDMYWLAFASLKQASSAFIQKLYEHFGDIETAWNADISELIKIENITKKQLDNFVLKGIIFHQIGVSMK
jgi:DNA processing protein